MTWLLLLLLPGALRYTDAGEKKFIFHALLAGIADVIVAHTTFAQLVGKPLKGEWTVSQMLERLCKDYTHKNYLLFYSLAVHINETSPTKNHIKAILET